MSPEQAAGQPTDARSDLFSLGSVLYFLCASKPAFAADGARLVMQQVRECQPVRLRELVPSLPTSLVELIEQLMSREPTDRPPSARAVCQALHHIEASLSVTQPARDHLSKPRQTTKFTLSIGLATVLLLTIIVAFMRPLSLASPSAQTMTLANDNRVSDLPWSVPRRVAFVDGISDGSNPSLTEDGLRLLFISASREPGTILEAVRTSIDQPFGVPQAVTIPPPLGTTDDAKLVDGDA